VTSLFLDLFFRDHGVRRGLNDVGNDTDRARQHAEKFSAATAAGAAVAAAAIFKFGSDSVKAYTEAQQSSLRLHEAFRKFPALASTNQAALEGLNSELAKKTRFDDDATASGQAVLAQFKLTGTQITELTPLMQDYAAKTGKDIPAAATVLGKAMLGQGKALKGIGISFKDAGSTGANFDQVMAGLRTQVGGFAEQEGKTAAGQAEILKNQFGELQEAVGEKLLPALLKASQAGLGFLHFIEANAAVIGPLTAGVIGLGVAVWTVNKAVAAATAVQSAWTTVTAAATAGTGLHTVALYQMAAAGKAVGASMAVAAVAVGAVWAGDKVGQWQAGTASVAAMTKAMQANAGQSKLSAQEISLFSDKGILGLGKDSLTTKDALDRFGVSAFNALDQGWDARLGRWQSFGSAESKFQKQTEQLDAALAGMARGGNLAGAQQQMRMYEDAAEKAGVPLASLRKMFPQYAAAVSASIPPVNEAEAAVNKHNEAIEENIKDLGKNAQALLKSRGSHNAYESAVDDATKALKENGRTLDVHTDKGRANRSVLDRVASSTLEWRDAAKEAGASQKRQTQITELGRAELVRMARRFGLSRTAAREYAREVLGIPKRVSSTISLSLKNGIPKTLYGVRVGGGQGSTRGGITFGSAKGGPIRGPGTETSDSIYTTGPVTGARYALSNNEHVWTALEVRAVGGHERMAEMRRAAVRGYAGGGPVFAAQLGRGEAQIAAGTSSRVGDVLRKIAEKAIGFNPSLSGALNFARAQVGKPYIWGGVGPRGYDCSGAMSALLNVVQGRNPYSRRFATGSFPSAGFVPGFGSFAIGSRRGAPGHMAGTINGVNVESSGSAGFHMGRSARGARHPMFTGVYHLRGYARGGPVIGDGPYDLLNPDGDDYLGDRARKMFLADRGGIIRSGSGALNRSGSDERMLSPAQTRSFDRLTRVLDRRPTIVSGSSDSQEIDYARLGDQVAQAFIRAGITVKMDGRAVGTVLGTTSSLLGRAG
jgi:ribosomal protein S14